MEAVRISVAHDVGGIELMHARLDRATVPPHMHEEYSISVPVHGGLAFDYRGCRHAAESGVISCVAPGEVHNASAAQNGRWEFLNLLVPTALVRAVLAGMEWRDRMPDLPRRVVSDASLVRRIIALHGLLEERGELLQRQSGTTMILAEFFRKHSTASGERVRVRPEVRAVQRARELLHECFAEPVPLARLASHAGLSPYHFLRTFQATVGMTPHRYLNQVRFLEAKRRLSCGDSPAEAAAACGFYDQSHMHRQFKRLLLATPGQYQKALNGALWSGPPASRAAPADSPPQSQPSRTVAPPRRRSPGPSC